MWTFENIMRNFRNLEVWQESRLLVKTIYDFSYSLPNTEKFGLISQLNRCAISIPSNIAEGCAKYSQNDFVRYLQISLGSLYELETQVLLCIDLNFKTTEDTEKLIETIQKVEKKISALIKYNKS